MRGSDINKEFYKFSNMNIFRKVLNMIEENMKYHVMSPPSVPSEFLYLRVEYSCA
jgi:uncharacterized protein YcgI (DUF1989 family)